MGLNFNVPAKAYQGGNLDIDGEYDFGSLAIKPDVDVVVYVDTIAVAKKSFKNSKRGAFVFRVPAPVAPATRAGIKVVAKVTSMYDKGRTNDANKVVELVAPGSSGMTKTWVTSDADIGGIEKKWLVAGGILLVCLVAGIAMTR